MSLFSVWPKVVTSSDDWIEYFLTKCEFSAEQWLCLIIYYKHSNNCCIFIGSLFNPFKFKFKFGLLPCYNQQTSENMLWSKGDNLA